MPKSDDELIQDMELTLRFGTDDLVTIIFNGRCPKCFQFLSWRTKRSSGRRLFQCNNESCTFTSSFPKSLVDHLKENPPPTLGEPIVVEVRGAGALKRRAYTPNEISTRGRTARK
jgi:hypothetical protein